MENYDQIRFMTPEFHNQYFNELPRITMLLERGICLEKVSENLLIFNDRLIDIGWRCFALDIC